jgi:Transposase, Mutator family
VFSNRGLFVKGYLFVLGFGSAFIDVDAMATLPSSLGSQHPQSAPPIFIPVTNAIESLNAKLRRAVRARGHFPTDESALKLFFSC